MVQAKLDNDKEMNDYQIQMGLALGMKDFHSFEDKRKYDRAPDQGRTLSRGG